MSFLAFIVYNNAADCYLLPPKPRCDTINPANGDTEPSEGADLLASEAEDEVAVDVATEGQADVHEADVLTANLMGIADGVPVSDSIGMKRSKTLTA